MHVSFNTLDTFCNSFNGVQKHALWVVLEEVTAKLGGLKQFNGLLKDKISSTQLLLELKNKERQTIPWYGNIIIFSNEFNILTVSRHDRRLAMFQSDPSKANNKKYFTQVYKELDDLVVMRAAFQFFKGLSLGDWNYRNLPKSLSKSHWLLVPKRLSQSFIDNSCLDTVVRMNTRYQARKSMTHIRPTASISA